MALNFADRLVSNNPSAYGIVRAIEVSGHKTVSSLSALYKIPDCILSDTGDNSGNDSLGQLWYVIDAKEVYQLVNWEKRNEAGGWKPYLSGVITDEALKEILNTKQDKLIAGEGISISEDNVISCTIDTSLFRMVDELPSLEEAETNKIYLLRKENNIGELQSYTEYIVTIKVDEEGKEIKEWEKIGEYDLSIELAPYLKIEDAEKTYVKKENIVDSFEGGDPKEQVLSAEKGKELKELVDSLEERKVDSVTATEGKGIIVEGTHNDPTIGVLRDPESEGFFTIEETGLKLSGVQDAIDEAVGELTDRVELESDVVYNINEIFPGEGKGENGDQWHIQYAAAKLDAYLPAEKKVPGIKVKFINLDGNWRTFTFNGGYFLDGRNWSYDITSNDFTELATENLPTATPESNGVMSKEDKAKLDGISETINKDVDDKIAEVKETIDNYTVNGYKISTNPSLDRNDIGLGNVTNDAQIKRSEMGVPKGVATLGEDGKVPESQLPDSVLGNVKYQGVWDAVNNVPKLELNDFDSNGHYYIAINKGSQFGYDFDPGDWVINSNGRWVKIDNVDSVKSVNGQIGIVELGIEDIPNLKETLDSKATNDDFNRHLTDYKNPHKVTKDQVGLGNVDNTADKDKPISNATQALIDQTRTVLENKISELQTNTEADLEVFRSEFENKLAELAAKEEADIVAVNNSLKEAKTELQNNIDNLASKTENDLTVAKKELDNKISELSTKTESDLSTLRADLESSISVTKTELEKSISELASKTENDLNTAKSELEKAISDLTAKEEADIVAVNNALSEAKKELENSISSLASKTENDLSLATKDLNNKISELATKTESDLSTLRADLESSISVTKTDLESKITELATKTDAKFQATDSKIEATKTELQTNIDNLSHRHDDDMKDIRREIEEATAGSNEALNTHIQDKSNPHQVTKEQVGLGNVTDDAQVKRSEMGMPEGVATLDATGKVPSSQLPSFVDDVIEVDSFDLLPETGETGKIYVTKDTNLTYRWSGSQYVEISESLALGETSSTAYPGDKGKATTDKVNAHVADFENPHQVTKEQIGLGNVDNTSDADKPISSAVQEALDAVNKEVSEHKADKNNPHEVTKAQVGLGNVDNTADLDKPVSNATQELVDNTKKELDTKIDNHTSDFNNPHKVTKEQVGLGNVDNTADINKPVSVAQQALVDSTKAELKKDIGDIEKDVTNHIADKNNPHEVNKLQVGLGNVDNTSDINKPVSIAQQAALDKLKSDLESIIGSTGTDLSAHLKDFDNPHKVTKDQVGLGKVDNTADLEKPVSVATQEAINAVQSNLDKTNISLENHIADKKNPHEVTKEQVGLGNVDNTSDLDKPVSHYQQDALDELERRLQGSIDGSGSDLSAHISDFNNPHKVTKDQVGLGNVDNTADKDKPISDATQKALDSIKTETNTIIETHIADKKNPHEVTKEQIGLGEVTNDAQVKRSEMGVAGGVATLDPEGKVPSSQLPSFVDDVIEVDSYDNLPTTGEAGKIYVTKDTNLTYRWSGSRYIEISASLALGETSSTAYAGDKGKATTDSLNAHLADFNNPHKVDKAQVGLGNVDNTSDKDKPVSDATQQLINEVKESINSGNTTITDNLTKHIEDYNNPHKVTKDQVGLGNVDNTSDKDKPLSDAAKEAINEVKTLITSSGTDLSNHIKDYINPHRVTAEQVGLGNVNNTSDLDKPISNATQKELDKLDAKIDKINTDQGTDLSAHLRDFSNPHKVTKEQIGLGNVDNTADLDKPISTATQKAIDDAKAANNTALDNHANRTDNPHKVTKDQVGLGNVDNTADINKPVSVAQQNALDTLSNSLNTAINNHVGNTNNPHQVTKEQVGLGKVDNTSDLEKPISVATQNAISEVVSNLDKHIADKNNPHEVTKEQIGLGRVDNTSDLEKPISTATQVALDKKAELGPDGKIPESQLPERTMHSLFYKGTWDAERNLPTLANGDKAQDGDYYLVNNDGESFGYKFMVNDIIFNASGIWYRMMGSNKRDNPTEFKITKFTADRTLLERGESTEITLEWEYQLTPSGQINFQFIDTHDIPVEERTYKITATGGQTFTLRGSYLSKVATATLTIDTADKVYVGASSNSAPTDSDFIAMNSFFSFGDNEFPFTPIDCSGGKYIYVAIPTEEYSKYRIYCNNYPVDDVTVYSRRITNIFTGYTDYTITKLANLYHGILNIEVKLIDKR
jgi:guanylate kinase